MEINRKLLLKEYQRSRTQLFFVFEINGLRFTASYWYSAVDFFDLEARYGDTFMENIYFHIAAFEINKICSLKVHQIDFGPFKKFQTDAFELLWKRIFQGVWAQWRFENDVPFCPPPELITCESNSIAEKPVTLNKPVDEVLSFCGGGKDSLVTLSLLEQIAQPLSTLGYSYSGYGSHAKQHHLIGELTEQFSPQLHHQVWVFEDFMDSPVQELYPEFGTTTKTAAETPSSIFSALPLVLAFQYPYLALGHERSADRGNMIWGKTDEEINHQWGKSFEAETLLHNYIQKNLISNVHVFSPLKPIHDALIFFLLRKVEDKVKYAHSCNIEKPWCEKCPKCAYVWLNYCAYLSTDTLKEIFKTNLFDTKENQESYERMLGLMDHTPFECIGEIGETKLAFELSKINGCKGKAIETFSNSFSDLDSEKLAQYYFDVDTIQHNIPEAMRDKLLKIFHVASIEALAFVKEKSSI